MKKLSAREYFSDQLRLAAGLEPSVATDKTLSAFSNVPREAFAGPGPWYLRSPLHPSSGPPLKTLDADPRWLYHDMLVVLDIERGVNIGQPSMWARLLAKINIQEGRRVLQVGAGVGYYTAILSELVGINGEVIAFEVEPILAKRATANLSDRNNVKIYAGNAATHVKDKGPFDLIVAFAGVTHVPDLWTKQTAPNAQLLLPLTGKNGMGAMVLMQANADYFQATTLGRCGFYPCQGARNNKLAHKIDKMFQDQTRLNGWQFRIRKDGRGRLETIFL